MGTVLVAAQGFAHFGAVQFRHDDVQHHQIRARLLEPRQGLFPILGFHGSEAGFLQGKADDFADVGIVINDQNGRHGTVHRARAIGDGQLSRFGLESGFRMDMDWHDPRRMPRPAC